MSRYARLLSDGARRALVVLTCLAPAAGPATATESAPPGEAAPGDPPAATAVSARDYTFNDVTTRMGVYQVARTWGTAWTDYEGDGDPDLFVGRHWRTPRMFVNRGDVYTRLRRQSDLQGTQMDRHLCVWGEANGDGAPDLYCVQGADKGQGSGPNQLLINEDGDLVDHARGFGVTNTLGRGRTANWIDFDTDGDLDLFVGNAYRRGVPNVMFRNTGRGFQRAGVGVGHTLDTVGSSWSDWDHDGDPDLLVTQHYPFRPLAYRNDGGRFTTVSLTHITGRHWASAAWGDYDGDGWSDLHLVSKKRSLILRNAGGVFRARHRIELTQGRMSTWLDVDNDGDLDSFLLQGARGEYPSKGAVNRPEFLLIKGRDGFTKVAPRSIRGPRDGNGEAISASDHNRDGRVDVFITNGLNHFTGQNELLENTTEGGNWVGLDLVGHDDNPLGMGARVIVGAGRLIYRREITDGASFRSQSEVGYVHLGIAGATTVTINVRWPDGTLDCFSIPAGTILVVEQGTLPCA